MIPNLDQLLIVCGIAIAGVALIMWLLMKIPGETENDSDHDAFGDR